MRYLFSWISILACTTFVTCLSILPLKQPSGLVFPYYDKVLHFILYWLFAYIVVNTFRRKMINHAPSLGILYIFCIGLALEAAQYYLPYRSFETTDALVNLAGGLASLPLKVTTNL